MNTSLIIATLMYLSIGIYLARGATFRNAKPTDKLWLTIGWLPCLIMLAWEVRTKRAVVTLTNTGTRGIWLTVINCIITVSIMLGFLVHGIASAEPPPCPGAHSNVNSIDHRKPCLR